MGLPIFTEYHRSCFGREVKVRATVCLLVLTDLCPRVQVPPPPPPSHPLLSTCPPCWARVECGRSARTEFLTQPHISSILPSVSHLFIEKEPDEKEDFLKTRKRKCGDAVHSCKVLDPSCAHVESGALLGKLQRHPANTNSVYIFRKVLCALLEA